MKLTKENVVEHFNEKMPGLEFDMDVLDLVINSFDCPVTMDTILNRHNDVLENRTIINGNSVVITLKSSITELPLSDATYQSLVRSCITHLYDISDQQLCSLRTLSLEAMAEATGALIASGLIETK